MSPISAFTFSGPERKAGHPVYSRGISEILDTVNALDVSKIVLLKYSYTFIMH
jgi:hypothetical protein